MCTPDWLYRLLPLVYALAGVVCLARIENKGLALSSALPLFAAAALTTYWRHASRQQQKPANRRAPTRRTPKR